ncbi:MAG: YdeI/OmpD-associated family protein [Planctomycetales bacterium]|nr:YdeI/OmpD-associated family protein [Planctomycetales bacterium]
MDDPQASVDAYIHNLKNWRAELQLLRSLALACNLDETFKWRAPCYAHGGQNVAILGTFKACCTLSFFKGALLADPHGVLVKPGENTQAARVIRFTELQQIVELSAVIQEYLEEAIALEKSGAKLPPSAIEEPQYPEELRQRLAGDAAIRKAFEALTPGRRRAYALHFAAAKQSSTRAGRIEKCLPRILAGKGPNDCICGLSKRMPNCDGSHKSAE